MQAFYDLLQGLCLHFLLVSLSFQNREYHLIHFFVSDPREIVKAGDIVKVKIVEVDAARKRISLTMRLDDTIDKSQPVKPQAKSHTKQAQNTHANTKQAQSNNKPQKAYKPKEANNAAMGNAFADAFSKLKK